MEPLINNLEEIYEELITSLEEIRVAHCYVLNSGRRVCLECHQIWPCRTAVAVIRSSTAAVVHMNAKLAHIQSRLGKTELVLQKIDKHFSAMKTELSEQVISLTHKLCLADGIQVSGYINASDQFEFQVRKVTDDETSFPLWSLIISKHLGVRIYSPEQNSDADKFFENLLNLIYAQRDVPELVEWWKKLTEGSGCYVTSMLPNDNDKSCQFIIELCHATAEFCDDKWVSIHDFS